MSTASPGAYAFLPWLRRGLASTIARRDGAGPSASHATAQITVPFNSNSLSATAPLTFAGPGEVAGLDPRAVNRVWPQSGVHDAEPNFFPQIEFDQADLPWRYTPAQASTQDRLRPWMCLIVLRDDEIESLEPATADIRLPVVTVTDGGSLPKLDQSWAWAHVQVSGDKNIPASGMAALLANNPERIVSRLVSPRRLDPRIRYTAMVVPTFERGRLSGTGEDVPDNLDGMTPAWSDGANRVRLPVYYQWSFQTGVIGDFEHLVRQLQARVLPPSVGARDMDVQSPGASLPPAATGPLALEGALRTTDAPVRIWPEPERSQFIAPLQKLLNQPAVLLSQPGALRVVAPPLYGRWHAAVSTLDPTQPPPWFQELNSDPRHRVAAGLGTQVVQAQQQQLMAAAWQQYERIRAINERLRFAQLAREASIRLHKRHVAEADADTVLQFTAPVHARVQLSNGTVFKQVAESPVGVGVLQGSFRRVTRPFGPIARRRGRERPTVPSTMLTRMNVGKLSAAPPPPVPASMATPARLADNLPDWRSAEWTRRLNTTSPGRQTPQTLQFRAAATALFRELSAAPADPVPVVPLNVPQCRHALVTELHPQKTLVESIRRKIRLAPGLSWQPKDPLEPIMAAPEFPQPMSQSLAELSQDWLLPGLAEVPPNTVSLLETNQKFIEAFMVGLNHEFARELLWNEYPTDQRGSCFRQFWNVAGRVPQPNETLDPETQRDIKVIHGWDKTSPLGNNSPKPASAADPLVLLVRGDLLRRYPNALVYAVKAKMTAQGRDLDSEEKHPIFAGKLEPDVSFFGFELTPERVRGGSSTDPHGWFFVLQERPSEPCFGLDVSSAPAGIPSAWLDLSWGHLAEDAAGLAAIKYIDLDRPLPDTSQIVPTSTDPVVAWHATQGLGPAGAKASDLAFITLQRPARVAIHGSQMLPPRAAS